MLYKLPVVCLKLISLLLSCSNAALSKSYLFGLELNAPIVDRRKLVLSLLVFEDSMGLFFQASKAFRYFASPLNARDELELFKYPNRLVGVDP